MTATFVSTQLNIAKSTLSNYENGIRTPGIEILKKLSKLYNTTIDGILDIPKINFENISYIRPISEPTIIPIYSSINTGKNIFSEENIIGYTDLGSEYNDNGFYFALYVTDDSMNNNRICEGDIIIVRKQTALHNGEVAVVLIEGEAVTIKKVFCTENTVTLMPSSANSVHKPRIIDKTTSNVNILGKVVEVKIKL